VFEITPDEQIVWEFFNPDRGKDGKRATIYRMTRITDPDRIRFLIQKAKAGS
jgi:ribosomal protein L15E